MFFLLKCYECKGIFNGFSRLTSRDSSIIRVAERLEVGGAGYGAAGLRAAAGGGGRTQ